MTQRNDPAAADTGKPEEAADESNMTLSLMGGVAKPEGLPEPADLDLESMKTGSRRVSQGTLVILLVFGVAAATLMVMRRSQSDLSGGGLSEDVVAKINNALAKVAQPDAMTPNDPLRRSNIEAAVHDTAKIIEVLNADPARKQVPLEYVKQNPFMLPLSEQAMPSDTHDPAQDAAKAQRAQELDAGVKHMVLQSVMNGTVPVAVIDGQFYKTGQLVGPFTIVSIKERQVELAADGVTYTLKMADEPGRH